jgi:hypothetical protein
MTHSLTELLVVIVTLSMAATPLVFAFNEKVIAPWLKPKIHAEYDRIVEPGNRVIIAGFGRFGQIVARVLRTRKVAFTAMEASPAQVDFVRRFGNKIYYSDASRLDLLRAARADEVHFPKVNIRSTAPAALGHSPRLRRVSPSPLSADPLLGRDLGRACGGASAPFVPAEGL